MTALSAAAILFLVLDPFGNVPLFLVYLKGLSPDRQRRVILRELVIALAVLVVFLFLGRYLLDLLRVSESSLGIAGGLVLFLIAIKMVFAGAEGLFTRPHEGEPFIVPLAIPLVAGPSAMATVILLMAREPGRWLEWLAALLAAWLLAGAVLLLSAHLSRLLGDRGLAALERLMGLLLTTVAVEMLVSGVRQALTGSSR
jgi:multiple antibiotic resistance protein